MGKIIQLSDDLANLIAAGEVVENPASVVKELVENALDAESTSIEVHLLEAGLKEIKIVDNGTGMDTADLHMAFKRHATSKIRTSHDLYHIASLGFRGEALPSIASVSELTIESSNGQEPGRKLVVKNGRTISDEPASIRRGTVVTVKNLFYNTPARLKHLKSEQRELSLIIETVQKLALAKKTVRFSLTHNRHGLLNTNGDGDTIKILHQVYDLDVAKNMLEFNQKNAYFSITGQLSKPLITRSSRKHINVVTNGRVIKNTKVVQAVIEAYKSYLPIQKYPIVHLEIITDPLLIDVNIHPQKLEVKFTEEMSLLQLIRTTLTERLSKESLITNIRKEWPKDMNHPKMNFKEVNTSYHQSDEEHLKSTQTINEDNHHTASTQPTKKLPDFDYIGQLLGTYLAFQDDQGFYLIDQHAAAERIRYERYRTLMGQPTKETRPLLIPFELHLSKSERTALDDILPSLSAFGLILNSSKNTPVEILELPQWFPLGEEENYTEIMIRHLIDESPISKHSMIDKLAIDLACKHSIKANHYLSSDEVRRLINDLDTTENPYTCPHGRPTLIRFTQTELEKMFKRIQS